MRVVALHGGKGAWLSSFRESCFAHSLCLRSISASASGRRCNADSTCSLRGSSFSQPEFEWRDRLSTRMPNPPGRRLLFRACLVEFLLSGLSLPLFFPRAPGEIYSSHVQLSAESAGIHSEEWGGRHPEKKNSLRVRPCSWLREGHNRGEAERTDLISRRAFFSSRGTGRGRPTAPHHAPNKAGSPCLGVCLHLPSLGRSVSPLPSPQPLSICM